MSETNAIELAGVTKTFPHFALANVDLKLRPGCIMGFIGPNGAGKSTTLRIIMGLLRADRGRVEVFGHRMPQDQVAAKWHVGFASEDIGLYRSRTLQWHLDFCRSIYPDWDAAYAARLAKNFDIRPEQTIRGLSHGQRVKAGLLLALARCPKLLVLDEPTTGLDPVARTEVLDELVEVLRDEHRSILFSSHNTRDVEQLSDQITFIDRGRIIASESKETYLDRWRRIRLELGPDITLPEFPDTVVSQRHGQLATMTTRAFNGAMTATLEACGASIMSVENLTLEEVFVAEVKSSRAMGGA